MMGVHILPQSYLSVAGAMHRADWRLLTDQLSDPSKHDKCEMAKALNDAADRGLVDCARVLLQAGTPCNIHDASGFSPLIIAAKKGHTEIIKLLLKPEYNCRINKATFHIRATALHWAATNGYVDCVKLLLDHGANPHLSTIHGRTPLMLAARCNEEAIMDLLLQHGSKVTETDFEGATALHLAAEEGADSCARALLKADADINAQMNTGDTPIICAARRGQAEVLRMLLHRSTLNLEKRSHHLTALHWAAIGGNPECVSALLYRGMSPDDKTLDSYSGGNLIVNAGVTPLMLAAERGHAEVIEMLLKYTQKVDECDVEGKTALLFTIQKQHVDCVQLLLQRGADPDGVNIIVTDDEFQTDEHGVSPIFYAIKKNNSQMVKLLLQANCNLHLLGHLTYNVYVTPLELAIAKQYFQLARMLLATGCGTDVAGQGVIEEGLAHLLLKDEQEFSRFAELFHTPPSLMQMTRNSIRQKLGRKVQKVIHCLPLPTVLQNYVNLQDLDDL